MKTLKTIAPVASVLIITLSLFLVVFVHMEERRVGYEVLKLNKEHRQINEERRTKVLQLARLVRPQNVERLAANRLTLKKLQASQVIHLSGMEVGSIQGKEPKPPAANAGVETKSSLTLRAKLNASDNSSKNSLPINSELN